MADKTLSGEEARKPVRSAQPRPTRAPGATPLRVYKPGQGAYTRWGTGIGAAVVAVAGAHFLHEQLAMFFGSGYSVPRILIPVALLVVAAYLVFWLVGKKRGSVDFMIATEGEMKKVNWSSRKEVLGATKVVIFSVLALGCLLATVDLGFMVFFSKIGVLKIPIWGIGGS